MAAFLAALGGAVGSAAGGIGGSALQYHFNKKLQGKAQRFQWYMDRTKYQRAVKDLRKAGLNPIYATTGGGVSAGGGGGGMNSVGMPSVDPVGGAATASAASIARSKQRLELENLKAQGKLMANQAWESNSAANLNFQRQEQAIAETFRRKMESEGIQIQNHLNRNRIPASDFDAYLDTTAYGKALRAAGRVGKNVRFPSLRQGRVPSLKKGFRKGGNQKQRDLDWLRGKARR